MTLEPLSSIISSNYYISYFHFSCSYISSFYTVDALATQTDFQFVHFSGGHKDAYEGVD